MMMKLMMLLTMKMIELILIISLWWHSLLCRRNGKSWKRLTVAAQKAFGDSDDVMMIIMLWWNDRSWKHLTAAAQKALVTVWCYVTMKWPDNDVGDKIIGQLYYIYLWKLASKLIHIYTYIHNLYTTYQCGEMWWLFISINLFPWLYGCIITIFVQAWNHYNHHQLHHDHGHLV